MRSDLCARAIARFAVDNGGSVTAVIERLGLRQARVVLIGVNGVWADQVLPNVTAAEEVCRLADVEIAAGWNRELSDRMRHHGFIA